MLQAIQNWFTTITWSSVLDVVFVFFLGWMLFKLMKGSGVMNIFVAVIGIFILWKLAEIANMKWTSQILSSIVNVGLIALIIVFQPEIRRFLMLIGSQTIIKQRNVVWKWFSKIRRVEPLSIDPLIQACSRMSKSLTGALIIIAKENELVDFITTGESINSNISAQLLETIFFKNTPLHDGAVIINQNRIIAARCILPVSAQRTIDPNLGLRHRSAIGLTEQSDAIAIIVSEQNGKISYCKNGEITRAVSTAQLKDFLKEEFIVENKNDKQS